MNFRFNRLALSTVFVLAANVSFPVHLFANTDVDELSGLFCAKIQIIEISVLKLQWICYEFIDQETLAGFKYIKGRGQRSDTYDYKIENGLLNVDLKNADIKGAAGLDSLVFIINSESEFIGISNKSTGMKEKGWVFTKVSKFQLFVHTYFK